MKKFFKDFKAFISRGNILDMAVGVIIGSAFSAIVTAFTNKIIMPLINYVLMVIGGGKDGLSSAYTFLKKVVVEVDGVTSIDLENSIYIDWGAFITAILNFLIIALTLFFIIKAAMKSNQLLSKTSGKLKENILSKEDKKELKKRGVKLSDKKGVAAYRAEKEKLEKDKKEKAEAEAKVKAEQERLENPTQEDLLKEIVVLLKEQNEKK